MADFTQKTNAYQILGLHKGAREDDIKHAFVRLVKKYTPEMYPDRFMVINRAFERLKDPEKRAQEDVLTFNFIKCEYSFTQEEMVDVPDAKLNQAIQMLEQKRDEQNGSGDNSAKLMQGYMIRSWKNKQKKLFKEAIEDWNRILGIDPTHRRAKNNLRCAYIQLGYAYANHQLHDEAIELWEKSAQMDPENHEIIHNLALAYEAAGRVEETRRYWDETLRRWNTLRDQRPDNQVLTNCIIEVHRHLSELGQTPGASNAPSARGQAPAAPAQNGPAPTPAAPPKAQMDTPEAELERCKEILRLKPDDFEASYRFGQLLMEQRKWKDAATHLAALQKKNPKNIDILNSLGWAQLNSPDVDTAIKTWQRGLKLDPKNFSVRESLIKARMKMGRALRDKNIFVTALVHFKALMRLTPDSEEVHYELGRTYQMKGDDRSAYMEFQKVLKLNPRHKAARTGLSNLKMQR